eukprot:TRINITY_DN1896_c0_g5_i2.p1 TRINITY_DN1896_c0_g5~~TRINITY_DN1896_c0_g5_i2.p1  ORF type:complete len:326 (+),score=60.82 TRINITY_DN1896_c0_g5_i2:1066-2043(+)
MPMHGLTDERLNVCTVFKIRRNYQRVLRRSDLSSILCAQKYVKLFRNDENLSMSCRQLEIFPFRDLDDDVRDYNQYLYIQLNTQLSNFKELINIHKNEQLEAADQIEAEELSEQKTRKRSPIALNKAEDSNSKLKLRNSCSDDKVVRVQETVATYVNLANDRGSDLHPTASQKAEQEVRHAGEEDNMIGPINTRLKKISSMEGDKGEVDEDANSVNSIRLRFPEEDKGNTARKTINLEDRYEEIKSGKHVMMEFKEGRTSREKLSKVMFSDDLSSIPSQSRDRNDFTFDAVFCHLLCSTLMPSLQRGFGVLGFCCLLYTSPSPRD